jgi:transcriptional regulator
VDAAHLDAAGRDRYSHIDSDMSPRNPGPLHGTIDLLILKAVSLEPLHGVGIAQRIEQITGGEVRVSYGSLFPALHRAEEHGWLKAEWDVSDSNRRAKYYALTAKGRRQLRAEEAQWGRLVAAVTIALRST